MAEFRIQHSAARVIKGEKKTAYSGLFQQVRWRQFGRRISNERTINIQQFPKGSSISAVWRNWEWPRWAFLICLREEVLYSALACRLLGFCFVVASEFKVLEVDCLWRSKAQHFTRVYSIVFKVLSHGSVMRFRRDCSQEESSSGLIPPSQCT